MDYFHKYKLLIEGSFLTSNYISAVTIINFRVQSMKTQVVQLQECISSQEDEPLPINKKNSTTSSYEATFTKMIYNLKYAYEHSDYIPLSSYQRKAIKLIEDSGPAYLLGQAYCHDSFRQFVEKYQSIIWLSYRANSYSGKTDAGWGCMIRVIQMVLAEVIRRNNPKTEINDVIQLFKEGNDHLFSLDNICKYGQINQRCTGSNQIFSIISSMLTQSFSLQALKSIGPTIKPSLNYHIQPEIYYQILRFPNLNQSSQFPRMIIISNRLDSQMNPQLINPKYFDHIKHLMSLRHFCGLIGGIGKQALYIVGFHEDKAILLDPHYIQDQTQQQTSIRYFKKTPRGIPLQKLKSSFSFCFFCENLDDYRIWASDMCYCHQIYQQNRVFKVQADFDNLIEKYRKKSQDFQAL